MIVGVRVNEEEEREGPDTTYHGESAYKIRHKDSNLTLIDCLPPGNPPSSSPSPVHRDHARIALAPSLVARVAAFSAPRLGRDSEGKPGWFVPNPDAPGKYLKVQ